MTRVTALAAAAAFAISAGALAQAPDAERAQRPTEPNPSLEPNYGSISLSGGFTPDPHSVDLRAGGDISARDFNAACRGWITESPDYTVNFSAGGGSGLFISVGSDADTTLVVHTPGGEWLCNDDNQGLNPGLHVASPGSGAYRIWVGSYANSGARAAALHISQTTYSTDVATGPQLDPAGEPNYGQDTLASGFGERVIDVLAGGDRSAGSVGGGCLGYVTRTPDYRVSYSGDGALAIGVTSEADPTIVVHAPDGSWQCNDDFGGSLNSQVTVGGASGDYAIWAGTYSATAGTPEAQITLSDAAAGAAAGGGDKPDESGAVTGGGEEGSAGHTALMSGFLPDPFTMSVPAGGSSAASDRAVGCPGFISEGPVYTLDYTAQLYQLFISVSTRGGATLVVAGPDGQVRCDASSNAGNGGLTYGSPASGRYQIWVGAPTSGSTGNATLNISEISYF